MDACRVGDVGLKILVELKTPGGDVVDVSSASTIQFRFRSPNGTLKTVTGARENDGTDGKVRYITQSGDIDVAGTWRYNVIVSFGSGSSLTSEIDSFRAEKVL